MKLKESYATETFVSTAGYYTIKQPNQMADDDSIIMLTPEQMRLVMADMQEWLKDSSWFNIQEPQEV